MTAPTPIETEKIQEGISQRKGEITKLNLQIRDLEALQQKQTHEEGERVRPTLEKLQAQATILQQQIAQHSRDHDTHIAQSWRDTRAVVLNSKGKILALEQEKNQLISLLAPIHHLPTEMLTEIFTAAITEYGCSALQLTHVCRSWRLILLALSRIWSKFQVGPRTSTGKIECLLERSGRVPLDVELDTEPDATACILGPCLSYSALLPLADTCERWRNLTICSFPSAEKLLDLEASGIFLVFTGPLVNLESFRVTHPCEMSPALGNLIDLARMVETSKLTILDLSSASALYRFADPSSSVFRHLRTFKVDFAEMKDPLDILPQFQCLEDMYVHRLHLPLYSQTAHLPLTYTLKRMFLKSTSTQWMHNRTFSKLVECTIIWPHFPETLLGHNGVDLPACTIFTYDDHLLQPLGAFNLPVVNTLVVRNEAWNRPRGSQQLGFIWGPNLSIERVLRPRVLHLDTQCYDQHLITALKMMPQVEELILGLVRPDALGKKFLLAMIAKKGRDSVRSTNTDAGNDVLGVDTGPAWTPSLCPNLNTFGLKYRRWLRDYENDELTPLFLKVVETRSKSGTPLKSFKVWPTKDTLDQGARELVA